MGERHPRRDHIGRRDFLAVSGAALALTGAPSLAAGQSKRGGEISAGLSERMLTLDPANHYSISTTSVLRHLYDPLIDGTNESKFVPALAETWRPVNNTTWHFTLRKGVTFHDGTPFNAESVAFTLKRARDNTKLIKSFVYQDIDYDPVKPSVSQRLAPPWGLGGTPAHLLGTDNLGRDILARLLYGGRISLALAVTAVAIAGVVGVVVGLAASWGSARADAVIMRVADVQLAFPVIMLAIAIVAVVGTNPLALVGVLALSGWVLYARTIRAHVLTIRGLDYIDAAHTLGASDMRIILRHVLPNTVAPILVIGSSQFATMVLLESGLSFLGMGIQAPLPSWGLMLAEGRDYLSNAWWLATAPGLMIAVVVLGANLLGDGLRDLLDPTLRNIEG